MAHGKTRQLYLNLPVRDLKQSRGFFSKLGFEFNEKFSDENAACMRVGVDASVMLLTEAFFKTASSRSLADTSKHIESLCALSCESKAEVDELVELAVANGGKSINAPQDHGFMYHWGFLDVDGHHWNVHWMAPESAQ
ncbi:VOC family protein [Myxococcus stipitatus]|nr:VOC family protein [Myxococcus stipitatus]